MYRSDDDDVYMYSRSVDGAVYMYSRSDDGDVHVHVQYSRSDDGDVRAVRALPTEQNRCLHIGTFPAMI